MIGYKEENIQTALNLLNEIPVTGLRAMERMVAVATVLQNGVPVKAEQTKQERKPRSKRRRK